MEKNIIDWLILRACQPIVGSIFFYFFFFFAHGPIGYESFLDRFIWSIDETLKGTTTPGQSGHGSNCKEEVPDIPQISRNAASLSDAV